MLLLTKIIKNIKQRGIVGFFVFIFQYFYLRSLKIIFPNKFFSKYARYPLLFRPGTSDNKVFYQIFNKREYSCLDDLSNVGLIIDCGANVGYSSAYFLSRFRKCYVIAIEPDPGNFFMMTKNLKPYSKRVSMLQSAIWSHPAPLTMSESIYRDGKEWSHQVRECRPGEIALFHGIDIGAILEKSNYKRISILKIDIEGAEGVVFSSSTHKSWIDKVDAIVIELHDDSSFGKCSESFFSAIKNENFDVSCCGELTVCKRKNK